MMAAAADLARKGISGRIRPCLVYRIFKGFLKESDSYILNTVAVFGMEDS